MKNEIINIELYSDLKKIFEESRKIIINNVNTIMIQTYGVLEKELLKKNKKVI